jgi:hypothetical protein
MADNLAYAQFRAELRKDANRAIRNPGLKEWDVICAVAECAAAMIDGGLSRSKVGVRSVTGDKTHPFSGAAVAAGEAFEPEGSNKPLPNPWFVWNRHEGDSPKTHCYLEARGRVGKAGAAVAVVGAVLSLATAIDVGAVVAHSNATISTGRHIHHLKAIAARYPQSQTIARWLDLVRRMKWLKAVVRGDQLLGSVVSSMPGGGAAVASAAMGVVGAFAKLGIKMRYTNVCAMTALELHWRAFQEQTILGSSGGTGPALSILTELFTRRGITQIFGRHDIRGMISEPEGWRAIFDKLLLI